MSFKKIFTLYGRTKLYNPAIVVTIWPLNFLKFYILNPNVAQLHGVPDIIRVEVLRENYDDHNITIQVDLFREKLVAASRKKCSCAVFS